MLPINKIHIGNNLNLLELVDDECIDLHICSPPYAKLRKYDGCDGIGADKYSEWLLPRIFQIERTLSPKGVFILNINDCVINGFRHPYVYELIVNIAKNTNLKMVERLFWNKGKSLCHPKRFRDPIEYIFVFAKTKDYYMNIDNMRLPYSEVSIKRMKSPIKKRFARTLENQDSNVYKKWSPNPLGALPSTLISIGSESKRQSNIHTAVYPEKLIEYFVKGFSKENNLICDIFSGSGTVAVVAKKLNRNYICFELSKNYVAESESRLDKFK